MSTDSSTAIARRHTKPFYSLRPDAKRPKFDYSLFEPIEVLHPISKDNAAVSNLIVSTSTSAPIPGLNNYFCSKVLHPSVLSY